MLTFQKYLIYWFFGLFTSFQHFLHMFSLFDICWQSILCFVTKERGGSRTCREGFESKPLDGNTHSSWRIDSVAVSLFVSSDRGSHSDDLLLSAPTGRVAVEKPEWQPRVYQTVLMESFRFLICQKVKGERGRILEKFDFAHFSRATTLACRVFVQEILGTPQFRIYASLEFTQPDLTQPESLISPNENCNHHYHKLNATSTFQSYESLNLSLNKEYTPHPLKNISGLSLSPSNHFFLPHIFSHCK